MSIDPRIASHITTTVLKKRTKADVVDAFSWQSNTALPREYISLKQLNLISLENAKNE